MKSNYNINIEIYCIGSMFKLTGIIYLVNKCVSSKYIKIYINQLPSYSVCPTWYFNDNICYKYSTSTNVKTDISIVRINCIFLKSKSHQKSTFTPALRLFIKSLKRNIKCPYP